MTETDDKQTQNADLEGTVQAIVRNVWNHIADKYNQWDVLGQDEKDILRKVVIGTRTNAEREV